MRGLQEHLEASDHVAEGLRKELRDLGMQRSRTHAELHQVRLQVAQLTLQLSDQDLALREERATWALEREAYRHAAEVKIQHYLVQDMHAAYAEPGLFFNSVFYQFSVQIDKKKLHDLSSELQRKEQWLQEERTERDNLEAELGREKVRMQNTTKVKASFNAQTPSAQNMVSVAHNCSVSQNLFWKPEKRVKVQHSSFLKRTQIEKLP